MDEMTRVNRPSRL